MISSTDITTSKTSAHSEDRELLFRQLGEALLQLVWATDENGNNNFCNARACDYFGLKPSETAKADWGHYIHAEDFERCQGMWQTSIKDGRAYEYDMRLLGTDGIYRWHLVRAEPFRNADGKITRWIGTSTNIEAQKRIEAEAKSFSAKMVALFQNTPALIVITKGPEHVYESVSPHAQKILGRELLGRKAREVFWDLDPEIFVMMDAVYSTARPLKVPERAVKFEWADGNGVSTRYFNFNYDPLLDECGKTEGILMFAYEVTEQVVSRKKLEESTERLRLATSLNLMGTWDYDFRTGVNEWDSNCEKLFGLEPGTFGRTSAAFEAMVVDEDRERLISESERAIDERREFVQEYRANLPNGKIRWMLTRARGLYDSDGKPARMLGFIIDVTQRKVSEERARILQSITTALSRALTPKQVTEVIVKEGATALGASAGMVSVLSSDRTVALISEYFGYPPASIAEFLPGLPIYTRTPLTDAIRAGKPVFVHNREEKVVCEARLLEIAKTLPYSAHAVLPLFFEREVRGAIGLSFADSQSFGPEDRSFMRLLAEQCAQALERSRLYEAAELACQKAELEVKERVEAQNLLRRAVKARDEFLLVASHELRTPLTTLRLRTQIRKRSIAKGDPTALSAEKMTKLVDDFDVQLDRLVRLVDDMLDISRINMGRLSVNRERCNLSLLTHEVLDRFSCAIHAANCALDLQIATNVIGQWDRYRIEQVLTNLLSNSLRYGAEKPISVRVWSDGSSAHLSIQDRGVGISSENHERIFQRFERAEDNRNVTGMGLGLYISKEIVEAHQGKIKLESELDRGALFEVELPLFH